MKTYIVIALLIAVVAGAETLILQPGALGKDCAIDTMHPGYYGGDYDCASVGIFTYQYRFLIEWDLSDIPEGADITSGVMELYCYGVWGDPTGEIKLFKISEYWDELTTNWINQPEYNPTNPLVFDTWPTVGEWGVYDITNYVQDWYEDENFGLIMMGNEDSGNIGIYTSDMWQYQTENPKLTIEYSVDPGDTGINPSSLGTIKAVYR